MGRPPTICTVKCDKCGEQYRPIEGHACKRRATGYQVHEQVTKKVLDGIRVDDLIKVNDWKKPMRVRGVSENYAVMTESQFGKLYYSVIEKKPWDGVRYNAMRGGLFHCGKDDWIFGSTNFDYKFDDPTAIEKYLQEFEGGETHLSERNAIPIMRIEIKGGGK